MRKFFLLFISIIISNISFSQIELKGTMGINFLSFPSVQDYINQSYPSGSELNTFNSAVIFIGEAGTFLKKEFELSIEIPYQIYSYTENVELGQYELAYNLFPPSALAYYVLLGNGYNFKFGIGIGPRFVFVTESKKWQGTENSFSSIGFGGLIRAEGNTALADNVYANIGFDIRYDINGEPDDEDGNTLTYNYQGEKKVNFDTFSLGVKLGISYIFGAGN